ncbi:MAG: hypothetical protein HY645_07525 [Acidobacteria bacterium]|nr:hypothetical protein [Acidobacteriota bacterium]
MTELVEKLLHATTVKDFVTLAKDLQKNYAEPLSYLSDVAGYLPQRLYEHFYEDGAPQSYSGLISATRAEKLLPPEDRWKPYLQQTWHAAKERKRLPFNLDAIPRQDSNGLETRWKRFENAANSGEFEQALGLTKGFLSSAPDLDFFQKQALSYALQDTFQCGSKFAYLAQCWHLAYLLRSSDLDKILFPALHFLIRGPRDHSISCLAGEQTMRLSASASTQELSIDTDLYQPFRNKLLTGSALEAIAALKDLAAAGFSPASLRGALLLAGAGAINNAHYGRWILPMRAFQMVYLLEPWLSGADEEQASRALLIGALLINQAAQQSVPPGPARRLDELAGVLCPLDTFNVLRSDITHSDALGAVTAAYAILGMGEDKREQLCHMLLQLAIKNDGPACRGNDLLYTAAAIDCYRRFPEPHRDNFLVSAAYFLGHAPKKYQLFAELG